MKKILITGCAGFLGKNFIFSTSQKFKFFKYDKKLNDDLDKKKKIS